MLFRGSSDYPGENELQQFWHEARGDGNAHMTSEHTMFHCHVQPPGLHGSLKRMIAAVAAPLLRHDMLEREVRDLLKFGLLCACDANDTWHLSALETSLATFLFICQRSSFIMNAGRQATAG